MSDPTTDPSVSSFLDVDADSPFPIQNLPYGVFSPPTSSTPRVGVAIGEYVLDLAVLNADGAFDDPTVTDTRPFAETALNAFMALGPSVWSSVRRRIHTLLRADTPDLRDNPALRDRALHKRDKGTVHLPVDVGD